jgi:hypothetical protein
MNEIAKHGKGRYYEVLDPNQLPKIMISESKAARAENVQSGVTRLSSIVLNTQSLYGLRVSSIAKWLLIITPYQAR